MPTNEELIKKLGKDLRAYVDERIGRVIDLEISQAKTDAKTRADLDALAAKLRDVTAALVQADGAILLDFQDFRDYVMDSVFGPSYDAELIGVRHEFVPPGIEMTLDELNDLQPGAMIEYFPPKRKRWFSRAR